ncbi:unnamed protein product [Trichogramma brassicae]|uniref:Uncharacterized protein n=1 Tax=Trichogramma brassicae TaxID=86971 RepID=A0A6H5I2B0_9HYME|nr:unnamed protein product [Trichogramma brassicae]
MLNTDTQVIPIANINYIFSKWRCREVQNSKLHKKAFFCILGYRGRPEYGGTPGYDWHRTTIY